MIKDQEQAVSGGGMAVQVGGNIVLTAGLTYAEVKDIALDVYKANFIQFSEIARATATARAEEITEAFISKLAHENPEGLQQANDPGFQFSLLTVQREHARRGDKDLGELLVDLLVDRSKQEQRNIMQIVLDEALITAPKLTDNQLAILAVIFLFKYTLNNGINSDPSLGEYFDRYVHPFSEKIVKNNASYQHLEFTGCGAVGAFSSGDLGATLNKNYQGLFLKGFDPKIIEEQGISLGLNPTFFIPCINDPAKLQVNAVNEEALNHLFDKHEVSATDREKVAALFNSDKMSEDEIKAKCVGIRPYMSTVFEVWSDSNMKTFTLTSVGIAIAHANIKRMLGEFADLNIWIN